MHRLLHEAACWLGPLLFSSRLGGLSGGVQGRMHPTARESVVQSFQRWAPLADGRPPGLQGSSATNCVKLGKDRLDSVLTSLMTTMSPTLYAEFNPPAAFVTTGH